MKPETKNQDKKKSNLAIAKVRFQNRTKVVTVPKDCDIETGNYVRLIKISEDSA